MTPRFLRQLVVLLCVCVTGCDTNSGDSEPLRDTLIVEIENETALRLTTEGAPGCMTPMVVESRATSAELTVDVLGLRVTDGPVCLAIIPSTWMMDLPPFSDSLQLSIRHRGEIDLYRVRETANGRILEAVRTSSTRLGPR